MFEFFSKVPFLWRLNNFLKFYISYRMLRQQQEEAKEHEIVRYDIINN
jgi:hypothetical protein